MKYLEVKQRKEGEERVLKIKVKRRGSIIDVATNNEHPFLAICGLIGHLLLGARVTKRVVQIEWREEKLVPKYIMEPACDNCRYKIGKFIGYEQHWVYKFKEYTDEDIIFCYNPKTIRDITIHYIVYYRYTHDDTEYGLILESVKI